MNIHEEFLIKLPSFLTKRVFLMEIFSFSPNDFITDYTEEFMFICCGEKTNFEGILHFWVSSQQNMNWEGREEYLIPYLETAECSYLSEADFMEMLNQTRTLKLEVIFEPKGRCISALKMRSEWNDISVVAEFEYEFISFNWETTA